MSQNSRHGKRKRRRRMRVLSYKIVLIAIITTGIIFTKNRLPLLRAAAISSEQLITTPSQSSEEASLLPGAADQEAEISHETIFPDEDEREWALRLVNHSNPLESGYSVDVRMMSNGYYFDSRAAGYLEQMLTDMQAAGLHPVVCSAYRSHQKQEQLFQNKVKREMATGLSYDMAVEEAKLEVAYPGTSEHELGLAVDIISSAYTQLDAGFAHTAEAAWMAAHCHEYGFILRYPEDKTDITEYIYEPWHFRYVGKPAAAEIMTQGLCLEEYLDPLS